MKNAKPTKKNIDHYSDRIKEEGLVVIDDITELPIYGRPFVSQDYVFGINHCGIVEAEYNTVPVKYCQHDLSIIYPNHTIWAKRSSEDYRTTLLVISAEAYKELSTHVTFRNRFQYEQNPSFHLTDSQYTLLMSIISAMRNVGNSDVPFRKALMISMLDVLLEMTDHFRHQNELQDELAPQRISSRFYHALAEHHHKSHSVGYYADMFFLTPKYFSDVIKQETGHSAKYWIGTYLVKEAKLLLRGRRDLNMQQISDMLGYDDQTSFSRHFKKMTGIAPSTFRKRE